MVSAILELEDGSKINGLSFGGENSTAGEVVFSTGMMGYPESLTDPSYKGQILVLTYPIIGNYGVPERHVWESNNIQVSGLIVSQYNDTPSHFQSVQSLSQWFKKENKPLLQIKDTRYLTQKIRDKGAMLARINFKGELKWYDPNTENLVEKVSTKEIIVQIPTKESTKIILLIDCGAKRNIQNALLKRGVTVVTVPWDFDITSSVHKAKLEQTLGLEQNKKKKLIDGVIISNGPGDPIFVKQTIENIKKLLQSNIPTMGICLGHQLLSLAAGGKTKKLKYGHRSQNQPCILEGSSRCYITTQNHGFAVSEIPKGFKQWFYNANDNSNEGIHHKSKPFFSVQFHPEATPGPEDAEWLFDYFLKKL